MRARIWIAATVVALAAGAACWAQAPKPQDTEQWEPKVPVVDPGPPPAKPARPPKGAIVLFDGTSLDQWVSVRDRGPARWIVADGVMTVAKLTGNIETKRSFRNYQLHLEWKTPTNITGEGQGRGNSGLFLASTGPGDNGYELQILDSYRNETYVNGQAGAIYKQHPPLANPSRPPGQWQTFDVTWTAPTFNADGTLKSPARVTTRMNGVLIQKDAVLAGETVYIGKPSYKAHGPAPIKLQAHGDPSPPISFRNIWVKELP